jgi:hypothetical protein
VENISYMYPHSKQYKSYLYIEKFITLDST